MIATRRARISLTASALVLACAKGPLPGDDEAETTGEDEATTESETAAESEDSGSETSEELCENVEGDFSSWTVAIDGMDLGRPGAEVDLGRSCTIEDEGNNATLTLNCTDLTFALSHMGVVSEAIPDVAGLSVQLRFLNIPAFGWADRWLRLDFVGEDLSVFLIDAQLLVPFGSAWHSPWGLATGQECLVDESLDQYRQALTLERDGQMLELWPGETGQIAELLEVWVDRSHRLGPDTPANDGPTGWKDLAIVSRGHLAGGEVCDSGADNCGPGLACCYPCGIEDCDDVCVPEDPETMQCPPPPP